MTFTTPSHGLRFHRTAFSSTEFAYGTDRRGRNVKLVAFSDGMVLVEHEDAPPNTSRYLGTCSSVAGAVERFGIVPHVT